MSKYTTVAEDDVELNAYRHGDNYAPGYRDDPPNSGSFDSDDESNRGSNAGRSFYKDDDGYDEDYDDEEIAVQSMELQAASSASSRSNRSCKIFRGVVLLTFLVAWVAGGKFYVDQHGMPDSFDGFLSQLKSDLQEWRSNHGAQATEDKGEEEISALVEEELDEERTSDSAVEQDIGAENNDDSPEVEEINMRDEPDATQDEVESAVEQEEPEEELDELEAEDETEEEVQEAVIEEKNNVVEEKEEQGNLDYLVGASGTISTGWSVIEQVAHDSTSFT